MNKQSISNSTILMRVMCAVVFFVFTFCYLYFYQADVLAMAQHVLSGGKTRYNSLIGAVLITLVLYLLQLLVFAVTRLYKRAHALTYFPSLLSLLLLTAVGTDFDLSPHLGAWLWAAPVLLILYGWVAWNMYQYQPYEPKLTDTGLFSKVMWTNLLTLFIMFLMVGLFSNHNDVFHYRMKMENLMVRGEYDKALEVGKRSLETDSSLVMLRVFALAKKGELGEHLFEYPIVGGSEALRPDGVTTRSFIYPQLEIQRFAATAKAADDYRLCAYLLEKDLNSFVSSVVKCYDIESGHLPKHYREALTLYMHKSPQPLVHFVDEVLEADYADLRKLEQNTPHDVMRYNAVRDAYSNTYWYYFKYVKN